MQEARNNTRILQTFWSGGKHLLKDSFGWRSAEEHLMGWALSCLSLRRHYVDVVLYTDSAGKELLVDRLGLPYTDVQVVFDDFACLPHHWALAKVKTYSMQTEPFLHVDADVFAARPFPARFLQSPLAAQNAERGTRYYREMTDRMLAHGRFRLPNFVQKRILQESLPSYNMGVFGGCDTAFIRRYSKAVTDFANENHLNDIHDSRAVANCNVFVEQIFFAMMAQEEHRSVVCLIDRVIDDNGYTTGDFCCLKDFERRPYFHLIGGHKRNETVCNQMARQLLIHYPEYYLRLKSLFPECHRRMAEQVFSSTERAIASYHDFLSEQEIRWRSLRPETILQCERASALGFQSMEEGEHVGRALSVNPNLAFFTIPPEWPSEAAAWLKERLGVSQNQKFLCVALVPSTQGRGIHETLVSPLAVNILTLLRACPLCYDALSERLRPCFSESICSSTDKAEQMIRSEVAYLLYHGLLLPRATS